MAKSLIIQAAPTETPPREVTEAAAESDAAEVVDEAGPPQEEADNSLGRSTAQAVISIPMAAPLDRPSVEVSGMAWYGDKLILLPQFPSRVDHQIFALDKADILAYLRKETDTPLTPQPIEFDGGAINGLIQGFEGFESIAFEGDRAFLTVESLATFGMLGVLVSGQMTADGSILTLDPFTQASIPTQAALINMSDESVFVIDDEVVTLYEANGANINPSAVVHRFDKSLSPLGVAPMTNIEYRISDVTAVDGDNRFWAINYLWPGDADMLRLADDPLLPGDPVGNGASPRPVERLVEFQWAEAGVTLTETPPITLRLLPGGLSRNWEGIARIQDDDLNGFLLVTDEFPSTMLGFVKMLASAGSE